jgi:hypothetical protein
MRLTPAYRSALESILRPGESIEQAHGRVKAWDAKILAAAGQMVHKC